MKAYKNIFFTTLFLVFCLVALWFFMHRNANNATYSAEEIRYYKAAHAMHGINPSSLDIKVTIPDVFKRHDDTVALMYHTDKIFVFQFLATEFTDLATTFPEAQIFAAHARIALGEYTEAAHLLTKHIAANPYNPKNYELLCKVRSINKEFLSQYLICLEWQKKDPSCSKSRLIYTWSAYFNLERYDEAITAMIEEGRCLGYTRYLYAARAAFATNDITQVNKFLETALNSYPKDHEKIDILWKRMQNTLEL